KSIGPRRADARNPTGICDGEVHGLNIRGSRGSNATSVCAEGDKKVLNQQRHSVRMPEERRSLHEASSTLVCACGGADHATGVWRSGPCRRGPDDRVVLVYATCWPGPPVEWKL